MVDVKNYSRVDYQMDLIYYEDNLYFKRDNSCWAFYKIDNYTYEHEGTRAKLNLHNKLTRLFWNISEEFHFIDLPEETSIREEHEELKKRVKGNLKFEALAEIDAMTEDLTDLLGDKGNKYTSYLGVKLKNPKSLFRTLKEYAESIYQDPIRFVNHYAGLAAPEIYRREYNIFKQIEDIGFNKMRRQVKMERTNEYETQKLIKYLGYYGIGTPPIIGPKPHKKRGKQNLWKPKADIVVKNGKEYIRPNERELLKFTECDMDITHPRRIEINQFYKGRERKAYQAYLSIADLPETMVPGGEWLYYLKQSLDFPIYTSVRGKMVSNKAAKDELSRKKREIDDQEEHIRSSNGVEMPLDLLEQVEDAMIMEKDLKTQKFPLIYTSIIIVVAADSTELLEKRIDAVKSALEPIPIECPAGDQWLMRNEAMIGGEQYQKDYILRLPPDYLALLVPGASVEIGDDEGIYFAVTGSLRKPVKIAPWRPSQINRPPNATFTGTQGGGKSFTCDMIGLKTCKLTGASGLWIDPKGDRTLWPETFKTFGDEIRVTTFTSDEKDRGKLDPYVILKGDPNDGMYADRMKEASVLALDICMFLLAITRKDPRAALLFKAVQEAEVAENPAMTRIIEALGEKMHQQFLADNDELNANICKEMSWTLTSYKNMAYAALLFGEGNENAVDFKKQINVLQIQNLVFPEADKSPDDYTYQEIVGYSCILAITGYIKKFIMGDRSLLKLFVLDESTVMKSTPAGRNTMNSLHRMARALNAPGYFIGQSVDDIGDEKIKNNIGYKFCFKTTDMTEIRKVLEYYKLEETESNIEMLSSLDSGVCLFQDVEGRTAIVSVDYIFEEYLVGLDTRPGQQSA